MVESGFKRVNPDYEVIKGISDELQETVFGQEKAMDQLARAITRSRGGFSDPTRPEMVAFFLGPTGVGKTESAKALAKFLYGKNYQDRLLRIDCTNLSENHCVSSLKGSEPGYVGYGDSNILITPQFLDRGGVIILDEFEKAAPRVKKWFLPVFEEGEQKALVPRGSGWQSEQKTLDFKKSYIIVTSNVGAEELHKARTGRTLGFQPQDQKPDMQNIGISALRRNFVDMPELLGRIDSIVVFEELARPQFEKIFNKFIDEINQDQRYGMNFLAVTSELREFIIDHAETGEYGAREIRHKINEYLVDKASEIKFSGVLPELAPLIGDVENGEVIFWTSEVEPKKPEVRLIEPPKDPLPDFPLPEEFNPDLYPQDERPKPRAKKTRIKQPPAPEGMDQPKLPPLNLLIPIMGTDRVINIALEIKKGDETEYAQVLEGVPLVPTT